MIRLVRVELARFRSRRAIVLLAAAAVLAAVVLAAVTAYQTRPLSADDRANAAAQADLAGRSAVLQGELVECRQHPRAYLGAGATASACAATFAPSVRDFYPRSALDLNGVLNDRGLLQATGFTLALLVIGLMIIAGCTFAGADWGSGNITNQLIFESRRSRLWLAKAIAVVLGAGLVTLVALGGFWLALWSVADARGVGVSGAVVDHVGWHLVRAVALAAGAALGGFALTMVFRHAFATLALLFVYTVGGEIAVGFLPWQGLGRFSVSTNVLGWLGTRVHYFDPSISCDPSSDCSGIRLMSHLDSGVFLAALLAVAAVLSLLLFRRRDV